MARVATSAGPRRLPESATDRLSRKTSYWFRLLAQLSRIAA
jgi:hypothetical protein